MLILRVNIHRFKQPAKLVAKTEDSLFSGAMLYITRFIANRYPVNEATLRLLNPYHQRPLPLPSHSCSRALAVKQAKFPGKVPNAKLEA